MNDRALERAFAHIVIERRADLAQEECELAPVLDQVSQRAAQARVGFDLLAVDLLGRPAFELVHDGFAVLPMERQALLGRTAVLAALRVVLVDLGQGLHDVTGGLGELLGHIDELASSVGQAVRQDGGELAGDVGRQRVAHLHGRLQFLGPVGQNPLHVLARVGVTGEEQHHLALLVGFVLQHGHDARGVDRLGHGLDATGLGLGAFLHQAEHLHRRVVAVQQRCLRGLADQLLEHARGDGAALATMSHCVASGSGMYSEACRPSRRKCGMPWPYLSMAIMLAQLESYLGSEATAAAAPGRRWPPAAPGPPP